MLAFFENIVLPDKLEKFMTDVVKLLVVVLNAVIVHPVTVERTRLCTLKYDASAV
jgi:hypothetical protein